MPRLSLEDFGSSKKANIVVVLNNLRSMNNIGSILRTADAFRLEAVYLCGITASPPHPDIHKTALGAEESVDWQYFPKATEAVEKLRLRGYTICALEQAEGSTNLADFHTDEHTSYALIVGNEVSGVDQELIDMADLCLEIPQFGTKHSLNVSVATGIALWQMVSNIFPH